MQDYLKSPQRLNEQVACIEVLGLIRPVELIEQVSCREDIVLGLSGMSLPCLGIYSPSCRDTDRQPEFAWSCCTFQREC